MKLGDRVQIIDGTLPLCDYNGQIGTISTINYLTGEFIIKWPENKRGTYNNKYIELAHEGLLTDDEISHFENMLDGLKVCTCETRVMYNFGCKCEAGKAELALGRTK